MAPGQSRDAVPALAKALADKSADVRLTAAVALRRFGPTAKEAVAALAAAVKRDDGARLEALKTLAVVGAEAGPAAKESAVAAAVALADPDPEVRVAAAHALAHVGPADEDSRKALRKALDDPDDAVRGAAAAALLSGK
jgi:HEAT repeat protein